MESEGDRAEAAELHRIREIRRRIPDRRFALDCISAWVSPDVAEALWAKHNGRRNRRPNAGETV